MYVPLGGELRKFDTEQALDEVIVPAGTTCRIYTLSILEGGEPLLDFAGEYRGRLDGEFYDLQEAFPHLDWEKSTPRQYHAPVAGGGLVVSLLETKLGFVASLKSAELTSKASATAADAVTALQAALEDALHNR